MQRVILKQSLQMEGSDLFRGENQGISPLTGSPPLPRNFPTTIINTCNFYQENNLLCPICGLRSHRKQSQRLKNYKIFLGSMPPDPPSLSMLPHTIISPLYRKILYKTLVQGVLYSTLGSLKKSCVVLPEPSSITSVNINSSNDIVRMLTNDNRKKVENESIIDVLMSDLECMMEARYDIGLHKHLKS